MRLRAGAEDRAHGGVRRSPGPPRHRAGQEHDRQARRHRHRRGHLAGAAEVPEPGGEAAELQALPAVFRDDEVHLRGLHLPDRILRPGRVLAGRDGPSHVRRGHRRRVADALAGGAGADAVGGGVLQQDLRQAGQRHEEAGRHHGHQLRELPGEGVAAAGGRPALRGPGHPAEAGKPQPAHHRRHRPLRPPGPALGPGEERGDALGLRQRAGPHAGDEPG